MNPTPENAFPKHSPRSNPNPPSDREQRLKRIREEIKAGIYETPLRINLTAQRIAETFAAESGE